ncbi:hypothetical protein A9Q99_11530 [Gammaproteobacteria bacterium 45_16_T64]|nr:hypothetical protein A9Q99_11530 [Gammaproteobacteria bacterium 45_16_T64]
MGSIYLIRHGQASFGQDDYDNLSPLGVEQSTILGQHFKSIGLSFDTVYGGAMKRHRQTADACLEAMSATDSEFISLPEFNEYDHENMVHIYKPEFKSKTAMATYLAKQSNPKKAFQEVFANAMKRWVSGDFDEEYPESWDQFKRRCRQGLDRIIASSTGSQNVAVFTSGGPISSNVQQLLDVPDARAMNINWAMVNCSVTHCLYNNDRVSLNYFNNYSHLQTNIDSKFVTYR